MNALDYLLKPVDPNRLQDAVNRISAEEELSPDIFEEQNGRLGMNDQIFLKDGEKC